MRMAPTQRVEHALEVWVQKTREVVEVPVVPVQVTEHVFIARVCPMCERCRVPKVALGGVGLGKQRLGVNLLSLIVTLREEARLPVRAIQWHLKTVHQVHLSVGGHRSQSGDERR